MKQYKQIQSLEELDGLVASGSIEWLDLSGLQLENYSFAACKLQNIRFVEPEGDNEERLLRKLNFKDAQLEQVYFDGAKLQDCDFDGLKTKIQRSSFRKCKLYSCRFRETSLSFCDFRYAEIHSASFESSRIDFCDFYRAFLMGIIIFRKAEISRTSLFYTYFDQGTLIRRENIKDGFLIQENKKDYLLFLSEWQNLGTGERKSDQNRVSNWSPEKSMQSRYLDAEDIYKSLNGLWQSKGFLSDANWAFVKGKKMERKAMLEALRYNKALGLGRKLRICIRILWNGISDLFFGYGESLPKILFSYTLVIFLFASFYFSYPALQVKNYLLAVEYSAKSMLAMTPDEIRYISPLVDFLSVIQTSIGILITGIFGFILGNKIRNQ